MSVMEKFDASNPGGAYQNSNTNPNIGPNQRIVVFDEPNARQTSATVSLELGLEDDRTFAYPKTFTAAPARPTIAANESNEIEGVFISGIGNSPNGAVGNAGNANGSINKNNQINRSPLTAHHSPLDLTRYPVVPIDAKELSIAVQNKLTDYDFKGENLSIETRIERSQPGASDAPAVAFEVLDANRLRLKFTFTEQTQKFIGGRRLQFRIKDKERGDSDWYTIKQTFVRLPQIESVKCASEMNGQCQLTGQGIDYIQQVSTDGGLSWYPSDAAGLIAQPTADGQTMALIPLLTNKKLLQIKLRDFPKTDGLAVIDYTFTNSVKGGSAKRNQTPSPGANTVLNPNTNQSNTNSPLPVQKPPANQSLITMQNQMPNGNSKQQNEPSTAKSKPVKTKRKTKP